MRTSLIAALAALALPVTASAATPESGTLSATEKRVTWTGSVVDPLGAYDLVGFYNAELFGGGTRVRNQETCGNLTCDVFTLTVPEDAQELRIAASSDSAANVSMDISDPDGNRHDLNTVEYESQRALVADAMAGEWVVRVYGTSDVGFDYAGSAEISLPGDPSF